MLQFSTIEPRTLELLELMMELPELDSFNLVGGTALALQLGHRKSIDLDLFGSATFDPDALFSILKDLGKSAKINFKAKNTLGLFIDDVKVDIIRYDFPLIRPLITSNAVRLLSIPDIAAMKLSAIAKRGAKKDFWDLYFILKKYSLEDLVDFYKQKFDEASLFFVLKSLTFFEDADREPDPIMIISEDWETIKTQIRTEVNNFL